MSICMQRQNRKSPLHSKNEIQVGSRVSRFAFERWRIMGLFTRKKLQRRIWNIVWGMNINLLIWYEILWLLSISIRVIHTDIIFLIFSYLKSQKNTNIHHHPSSSFTAFCCSCPFLKYILYFLKTLWISPFFFTMFYSVLTR